MARSSVIDRAVESRARSLTVPAEALDRSPTSIVATPLLRLVPPQRSALRALCTVPHTVSHIKKRLDRIGPSGTTKNDFKRTATSNVRDVHAAAEPASAALTMSRNACFPTSKRFRWCWTEVFPDRLELANSKTSARTVRIGIPASKLLERRRPSALGQFVFLLPQDPDKPLRGISEVWAQAREGAELSKDTRLHDLRHTFASHAVMAGESLLITGALLGHRRAESTMRYSHLNDSFLLRAADKVGSRIHTWMSGTSP